MNTRTSAALAATIFALLAIQPAGANLTYVDDTEFVQSNANFRAKDLENFEGPLMILTPGVRQTVSAPPVSVSVTVDSTSTAVCHQDPTMPFSCDPQPGGLPSSGGAFFGISWWNAQLGSMGSFGREVNVHAKQVTGQTLGGFAAFACTDYNDDFECDSGSRAFASDGCVKSEPKNCDNPTDVKLTFCAERDDYFFSSNYDGSYDNFVVFIESWADVADGDAGGLGILDNNNDNTGLGASQGQFQVDVQYLGYKNKPDCQALNDQIVDH